jgi:hypothetical protein
LSVVSPDRRASSGERRAPDGLALARCHRSHPGRLRCGKKIAAAHRNAIDTHFSPAYTAPPDAVLKQQRAAREDFYGSSKVKKATCQRLLLML